MAFAVLADNKAKMIESEKKDKYLDHARKLKKTIGHEGDCDSSCDWFTWNDHYRISKGIERFATKRTSGDHLDYNILKISHNSLK